MTEHEKLYNEYLALQSKEWKADIIGWEPFKQESHDIAIKVNFKNGMWLRVYRNNEGIEWY